MSAPKPYGPVVVGLRLPPRVQNPTLRGLVQYAGASGDF